MGRAPAPLVIRGAGRAGIGRLLMSWRVKTADGCLVLKAMTAEETGCEAVVERLLGVDSRVIPSAERHRPGLPDHHSVGIFYQVRITGGRLRPEPNGTVVESAWTPLSDVAGLHRSSLVDVGLALARTRPATGHIAPSRSVG